MPLPREISTYEPGWTTVAELAASVKSAELSDPVELADELVVYGVSLDSRRVKSGYLYAALPGATTHGARFALQAVDGGAIAVITDPAGLRLIRDAGAVHLPTIVVDDPRAVLGALAAELYCHPIRRLLMFGVTGTNGKTTTTYLLHSVLTALGRRPGLIGTVETRIGDERIASVRTTPEAPDLQALLATMLQRGADSCAMEISSHALALHRVDAAKVDVAGFTNLSQDHLDFHESFEDYFAAKASLFTFERARAGVICVDDEWGRRLARQTDIPVTTLLTRVPDSASSVDPSFDVAVDWRVVSAVPDPDGPGMKVVLGGPRGVIWRLTSPLPGDFNVANSCLAALMLRHIGFDPDEISTALAAAPGVPGRMQVVGTGSDTRPGAGSDTPSDTGSAEPVQQPLAVVDYAHSPDSISAALSALRNSGCGPIAIVFGAGGDRDRGKRPKMGLAAVNGADLVVVTDDNPRSEDPAEIRAEVLSAVTPGQGRARVVENVPDRRAAIARALQLLASQPAEPAQPTDPSTDQSTDPSGSATGRLRPALLVAGKGHETGQEIAGTVYPFDDRLVLAELLAAPHPSPASTTPDPAGDPR